jgi:hypothetical protein
MYVLRWLGHGWSYVQERVGSSHHATLWMDGPRVYAQGTEVGTYLRNDIPLITMVVQRTYVQ